MIRLSPDIIIPVPVQIILNGRTFEHPNTTGVCRHVWHYDNFYLAYIGQLTAPWSVGYWTTAGRQAFWGPQAARPNAAWTAFVTRIADIKREIDG